MRNILTKLKENKGTTTIKYIMYSSIATMLFVAIILYKEAISNVLM